MMQAKILQPMPDAAYRATKSTALGTSLIPADHACLTTSGSTTAIGENTGKVADADMPKSWTDLPKFAGFFAPADPDLSGPSCQFVAGLFQTNGVDAGNALLQAALTNKCIAGLASDGKVTKARLTVCAKLGINRDSGIFTKIAAEQPLTALYPTEGSVALPSCIGIGANTAHTDAANKFIAYIASPEDQALMQDGDDTDCWLIPIVEGVADKPGRKINIAMTIWDDKAAAAHETEGRQQYKDSIVQQCA